MLALHPGVRAGIRDGGEEYSAETIWHLFFWGRPALVLSAFAEIQLWKTPFPFWAVCRCYQKQCLLLPEAVFAACINFHYILSNSFFYASFRHQLTEPLKEQMYWRNASIHYLLQFGGVCPMGFLAKGLYVSQEKFTFMREENWGKSLLLDPEVRDTGLLSFCTCEKKKSPQLEKQSCFNPSLILSQCEKLQLKPNFSLSIECVWLQLFIFSL